MPTTNIATAILKANESRNVNNTLGSEDKKFVTTVGKLVYKDHTYTAGKMPKEASRQWTLSQNEFDTLCEAEKMVYFYSRQLNRATDDKTRNEGVSNLASSLSALLKLCDPALRVGGSPATIHFLEQVRSFAMKTEFFSDNKAYHVDEKVGKFIRQLELELCVALQNTSFAPEYERDYQRACIKIPQKIRKAQEALVRYNTNLEKAKAAKAQIEAIIGKVAKSNHTAEMDKVIAEAKNNIATIEEQIKGCEQSIKDYEKALEDAKEVYEKAKESAENGADAPKLENPDTLDADNTAPEAAPAEAE